MVDYINPGSMHANPAYTQAVVIPAGARTMLIGGQNAVAADGAIVGKGDLAAQTTQALANLQACLAEAGAGVEHLVQMTLYIVGDVDIRPGFEAWMAVWGKRPNPPTVSAAKVLGLAHPDFLIEISGVAVLP